jgi:hypothetical protein
MKSFCVKSAIVFWLLAVMVSASRAQENCAWTNQTADIILNLRLGMTTEEAQAALGKDLKIKLNPKGDYRFFQNYIDKNPPPKLRGVRALYLRFFERKLYQIEIFYNEEFSPTLENFAARLAAQLDFPASEWIYENKKAEIRCGENSLAADYVLNPRVELTDETILAKVSEQNEPKR